LHFAGCQPTDVSFDGRAQRLGTLRREHAGCERKGGRNACTGACSSRDGDDLAPATVYLITHLGNPGLEDFGNGTVIVTGYPAMLRKMDLQGLVRDLIEKLEGGGTVGVQSSARRDILDELLHMMSCKAAVKAGQRLSQEEIESLLLQRHLVDDAHHCPHGRPTALSLSRMELDRQFGRLG
jgi:hypothetical protein